MTRLATVVTRTYKVPNFGVGGSQMHLTTSVIHHDGEHVARLMIAGNEIGLNKYDVKALVEMFTELLEDWK